MLPNNEKIYPSSKNFRKSNKEFHFIFENIHSKTTHDLKKV